MGILLAHEAGGIHVKSVPAVLLPFTTIVDGTTFSVEAAGPRTAGLIGTVLRLRRGYVHSVKCDFATIRALVNGYNDLHNRFVDMVISSSQFHNVVLTFDIMAKRYMPQQDELARRREFVEELFKRDQDAFDFYKDLYLEDCHGV